MFVLWAYSNSDMPSQPAIASGFATMKLRPEWVDEPRVSSPPSLLVFLSSFLLIFSFSLHVESIRIQRWQNPVSRVLPFDLSEAQGTMLSARAPQTKKDLPPALEEKNKKSIRSTMNDEQQWIGLEFVSNKNEPISKHEQKEWKTRLTSSFDWHEFRTTIINLLRWYGTRIRLFQKNNKGVLIADDGSIIKKRP